MSTKQKGSQEFVSISEGAEHRDRSSNLECRGWEQPLLLQATRGAVGPWGHVADVVQSCTVVAYFGDPSENATAADHTIVLSFSLLSFPHT
jgi:hypothetical protein